MKRLVRTARGAADSDATVLVSGERGVGKSVLAAAIHSWSHRQSQPFTVLACASLDEYGFEHALLPVLERCEGGTVLLDEIGNLSAKIQTWLTGTLKSRADRAAPSIAALERPRLIAATSRDLEAHSLAGSFRADLLHLVNVVSIRIPPLRERPEDLPLLARWVLNSFSALHSRAELEIKPQALAALAAYTWPGNLRELVNVLDQAAHVCDGGRIQVEDLPDCVRNPSTSGALGGYYERTLPLRAVERQHIENVVATSATLESAASRLGIAATTLWRKRKRYGM